MQVIRRIEVPVREVRWSENGSLVALICETQFYTLRFDPEAVEQFYESGEDPGEDGIEDAFELLNEVQERVRTGEQIWNTSKKSLRDSAFYLEALLRNATMLHANDAAFLCD